MYKRDICCMFQKLKKEEGKEKPKQLSQSNPKSLLLKKKNQPSQKANKKRSQIRLRSKEKWTVLMVYLKPNF